MSKLPDGWEVKKLGDVCQIKPPKKLSKEKLSDNDWVTFFPMADLDVFNHYITPQQTKKLSDVYKGYVYFEDRDVLLAKITPCFENGKLGIAINLKNGTGFGSSEYMVFRPKTDILSEYIYYFLSLDYIRREGKNKMTGAVGHKRIPVDYISNQKLIIPPFQEQQRIVTILEKAFKAIDKAKENAERNLKNTKELFESYLQGVFENYISGLDSFSLNSLCDLIVDCEHKTAPTQETGFPSIRTPNIGKGVLKLENVNRVSEDIFNKWIRRAIPQADDLILAREAPAGNIAVIPSNLQVCLGQRTVLIRPKKDKVNSKYLVYLILSKEVQKQLLSHSKGATVEHINMKDIRAFKIYNLPSLKKQEYVVTQIENLSTKTKKLETIYQQKIADLEELKKSILQKAFNGKLV